MPFPAARARPGAPYLAGAPLLIAHRGGAGLAPENTIPAFRQAVDWWGSDILELDVRPTRDGEVVVLHDLRVDRTTDGSGLVSELTLAQIRKLDAGYHFTPDDGKSFPYRAQGVGIPTLEELLREFPAQRVNIEVKDARASARTQEVVAAAAAAGRVLLAGSSAAARRAAATSPAPTSASEAELRTFYLLHRVGLAPFYRPSTDALQLPHVHRGREVVSPRLVADAHRLNLAVHVWTVDAIPAMRRLLAWGVDGVVTDRPDRLARVLQEHSGRPPARGPSGQEIHPSLERLLLAG